MEAEETKTRFQSVTSNRVVNYNGVRNSVYNCTNFRVAEVLLIRETPAHCSLHVTAIGQEQSLQVSYSCNHRPGGTGTCRTTAVL